MRKALLAAVFVFATLSTFIIWDRLFNTFEPEIEKPIYGLTKPLHSYNPFYLVFHEWMDLAKDLRYCRSLSEVWKVLFYPPGSIVTAHQKRQANLDKSEEVIAIKPILEESV